ncbi:MAG: hypothetical protein GY788_27895 [bacterium]|nr:hypothetical protein [bacterium]
MAQQRSPSRFPFLHSVVADARVPLALRYPALAEPHHALQAQPDPRLFERPDPGPFDRQRGRNSSPSTIEPDARGDEAAPIPVNAQSDETATPTHCSTPRRPARVHTDPAPRPKASTPGRARAEPEVGSSDQVIVSAQPNPEAVTKPEHVYERSLLPPDRPSPVRKADPVDRSSLGHDSEPIEDTIAMDRPLVAQPPASRPEAESPQTRPATPTTVEKNALQADAVVEAKSPPGEASTPTGAPKNDLPPKPAGKAAGPTAFRIAKLDDLVGPAARDLDQPRRSRQPAASSEPDVQIGSVDVTILAPEPPARPSRPEGRGVASTRIRAESLHYLRRF